MFFKWRPHWQVNSFDGSEHTSIFALLWSCNCDAWGAYSTNWHIRYAKTTARWTPPRIDMQSTIAWKTRLANLEINLFHSWAHKNRTELNTKYIELENTYANRKQKFNFGCIPYIDRSNFWKFCIVIVIGIPITITITYQIPQSRTVFSRSCSASSPSVLRPRSSSRTEERNNFSVERSGTERRNGPFQN